MVGRSFEINNISYLGILRLLSSFLSTLFKFEFAFTLNKQKVNCEYKHFFCYNLLFCPIHAVSMLDVTPVRKSGSIFYGKKESHFFSALLTLLAFPFWLSLLFIIFLFFLSFLFFFYPFLR